MSAVDVCAAAAIRVFPDVPIATRLGAVPYPVVMVAIAGAESTWYPQANGDCGLGGPSCGTCGDGSTGATSWGLWQIHNVHGSYLEQQTGSSDPCVWAQWLYDPLHNAQAAFALAGPNPTATALADTWSTFAGGQWVANVPAAQAAVQAAYAAAGSGGGGSGGGSGNGAGGSGAGAPLNPPLRAVAVPLGVLAGIAAVVIVVELGVVEAVAAWTRRTLARKTAAPSAPTRPGTAKSSV